MARRSNLDNSIQPGQRRRNPTPQARYWLGTINAGHGLFVPPTELPNQRDNCALVWLRGQKEIGEENGTEHWQLFAAFKAKVTRIRVEEMVGHGHWEPSRSDAAEEYVWKEETRVAGTQFEVGRKAFKRNSPTDWANVVDLAKRGRIDTILEQDPQVGLQHYRTLKQIKVDYMVCPPNLAGPCGQWIFGPPGVGKSFWARERWGEDLYIKPQNKWWDGYQGQKNVLIDDYDSKVLGHYLKIWLDAYAFTAEIKGGTIQIRPDNIIITSNYKIEELFDDPVVAAAVKRRCVVTEVPMRRFVE